MAEINNIETKNCTLKYLKWHYLTVQSIKNVAVLMEDRAFALIFYWLMHYGKARSFSLLNIS